jgi:hypothetical protein
MGKWMAKVCIPFTMAKLKYFDPGLRKGGRDVGRLLRGCISAFQRRTNNQIAGVVRLQGAGRK